MPVSDEVREHSRIEFVDGSSWMDGVIKSCMKDNNGTYEIELKSGTQMIIESSQVRYILI